MERLTCKGMQSSGSFVTGEYAAAIPARDMLAFCDSSSADGIAELHRVIERVQPTGTTCSPRRFMCDEIVNGSHERSKDTLQRIRFNGHG